MFKLWRRVRDGTLQHRTFKRRMVPIRTEIERLLDEAALSPCTRTQGKAKALLKYRDALWTFVDVEGIPPTNNEAYAAGGIGLGMPRARLCRVGLEFSRPASGK